MKLGYSFVCLVLCTKENVAPVKINRSINRTSTIHRRIVRTPLTTIIPDKNNNNVENPKRKHRKLSDSADVKKTEVRGVIAAQIKQETATITSRNLLENQFEDVQVQPSTSTSLYAPVVSRKFRPNIIKFDENAEDLSSKEFPVCPFPEKTPGLHKNSLFLLNKNKFNNQMDNRIFIFTDASYQNKLTSGLFYFVDNKKKEQKRHSLTYEINIQDIQENAPFPHIGELHALIYTGILLLKPSTSYNEIHMFTDCLWCVQVLSIIKENNYIVTQDLLLNFYSLKQRESQKNNNIDDYSVMPRLISMYEELARVYKELSQKFATKPFSIEWVKAHTYQKKHNNVGKQINYEQFVTQNNSRIDHHVRALRLQNINISGKFNPLNQFEPTNVYRISKEYLWSGEADTDASALSWGKEAPKRLELMDREIIL